MKKFNLSNSKIFKFFDYCFRLVLINLLIIIPSFLLFISFTAYFCSTSCHIYFVKMDRSCDRYDCIKSQVCITVIDQGMCMSLRAVMAVTGF